MTTQIQRGSRVRITSGPFKGRVGVVGEQSKYLQLGWWRVHIEGGCEPYTLVHENEVEVVGNERTEARR